MQKRVLVVGGSEDYVGAVYLAGVTALRSGAESVIVMAPEKVAWAINALSPDLVTRKLPGTFLSLEHKPAIDEKLRTTDILIIGNGAGLREETSELMRSLMDWDGPKVIDADALKVLSNTRVHNAILTPNPGEWELLIKHFDESTFIENGNVIIRKGDPTTICNAEGVTKISVNAGLHKAGTGDVLAGLCAGALARGHTLSEAARFATTLGNDVAELLTTQKQGYYFLASDLVAEIEKFSEM